MDEIELVGRLQARDEDALRVFITQYRDRIFPVIWRVLRDSELAEEAWGDVLTKVWVNIVGFDASLPTGFRAWVYRIASNCALDLLRTRDRRRKVEQPAAPEEVERQPAAFTESVLFADEERAPSDQQIAYRDTLRDALARLNQRQRRILLLRAAGHSPGQVAQALGMSPDNAYTKSNQAAKALLRELRKDARIQQCGITLPSQTEILEQLRKYEVEEQRPVTPSRE